MFPLTNALDVLFAAVSEFLDKHADDKQMRLLLVDSDEALMTRIRQVPYRQLVIERAVLTLDSREIRYRIRASS
jgi:hypothetical protein